MINAYFYYVISIKKKKKIQKKSEIFKKRNFLGQALDFLPHPGNQVSIYHVWIFFLFEYHEWTLISGQNLSKPAKILISLTKSRNLSRNHCTLMLLPTDAQYLITNFMIIGYNKWRSSRSQMFFKIAVLKNFAIFARKHLWWILFLINLFNKNTYFEKHLRTAAFEI